MRFFIILTALTLLGCSDELRFENSNATFERTTWDSSINERYQMLQSVSGYNVVGLKRIEIISLLGEPDGYYLYDEFPAYRLNETRDCLVVFTIDHETDKVTNMSVEPNNCAYQAN
ncbi:MAG: hypothetical protein HRT95_11235 [Moritella sp.]|uniref:hypothetical protein n=1 Tax=Moritella sp. TaxID=78556 RepID=UPI001DA39D8C|nr:hypothetical protein [Moritella sp.]NQZ50719.1 hypothetical protein [Moritella sp.]